MCDVHGCPVPFCSWLLLQWLLQMCLSSDFTHSDFPQSPSAHLELEAGHKENLIHGLPCGELAFIKVTSEMPSWETFKTEK